MIDAPQDEELLVAQREIRHLKETITALRAEMEAMRAAHADELQGAASAADAEMRQLRDTAAALRDQLEVEVERGRQKAQDAERTARDEHEQLRDTIRALRDELEAAGVTPADALVPPADVASASGADA